MKYIVIFLCLFVSTFSSQLKGQDSDQIIFLVRHAEKTIDGTKNPHLTEEGKIRAERLAFVLRSFDIKAVFSTDYFRTKETASPLTDQLGLTIQLYEARAKNIPELISQIDGNVLIVGHSNTIPQLTNELIGLEKYEQLDDKEYSNLFIVSKYNGHYGSAISKF